MASNGSGPGKEQKADTAAAAIQHSCDVVEKALGKSHAFRVIERGFYVVKQGSSVVMINVLASGANRDRALPARHHDRVAELQHTLQVAA